jgi:23S rRNA pseudouridine2605 synthase
LVKAPGDGPAQLRLAAPRSLPDRQTGVIAGRVMADNDKFATAGERIARAIARAGLASRREAEEWIGAGRVAVNGALVRSPALNVTTRDRITVDGVALPTRERTRLFLYHKPRGLLTAHADPRGRTTIFEHLPKDLPRLISVGRLDFNTEGLLLLTNDGALARTLELPSTGWLRRYRVRAHGAVTQSRLDELWSGVTIDGVHYRPIEALLDRVQGSNVWLTFAIREGKNREVRNVLDHLGLTVTRLIRVSFGPFQLGELAEGAIEEVRTRVLREQLGERVVAASGVDFSAPVAQRAPEPPRDIDSDDQAKRPRTSRDKKARASHSWRAHEEDRPAKKLRRKFRGSRRDDTAVDQRGRARPAEDARIGLIADRRGRRVLVERFGQTPPQDPPDRGPRKPPRRHTGGRGRRPRRG